MIIKEKQEDGSEKEVEVFTQAELDAKIKETTEPLEKQVTENKTALETATKELEDAKSKLEAAENSDADDKDKNIGNLRSLVEKQEKVIKDLSTKIETDVTQIKDTITSTAKSSVFSKLSGGDKDLLDKMELNYKLIAKEANTEQEIAEKATLAYKMSVDSPNPTVISSVIGNAPIGDTSTSKATANEVIEAGKKFGLSEADFKKYPVK